MIDVAGLPMPPNPPPVGACVRVERPEAGLVVLVLDPPHRTMPVFDTCMLRDLDLALEGVEKDASVRGLVVTGRDKRTFAAGADLDAIASLVDPTVVTRVVAIGQQVFERIAKLSRDRAGFTSVAAIAGAAPGGACELALACSYVVLADTKDTRIGLPETQLGILPGWGGTSRLPRRIGVPLALDAILTGKLFTPREALKRGIADRLVAPENMMRIAADLALGRTKIERRTRGAWAWLVDKNPLAIALVVKTARKQVMSKTHGNYPAPLLALEIAARAPVTELESSFAAEQRAVAELAVGPVSKNLIQIFRLSEDAKRLKNLPDGSSARVPERIGVLGAGVMGRGIASLAADRGAWTRLYDIAPEALDAAQLEHRREVLDRRKRRRIEAFEADEAIDRFDTTRALEGFARCDLVVEAVAERLDVKRKVFAELARQVAPTAILATNTSSLSVDAIAAEVPHPERVVGLHFFNPVKRMPLVEIVRGAHTSPRVVAECAALALRLGKTPVVVRDVAGFLVNRLLGPYLDESLRLFAGGIEAERIDAALVRFGMPMGPLALLDEVGFDIAQHAAAALFAAYGARMTPSSVLESPVREKRLGKKSGLGFYRHAGEGERAKPTIATDIARFRPKDALECGAMENDAIAERVVLAMLAEAARALEEGVVASARELDLATVFGMGFAPFRGGLLRWADTLGAETIVAKLAAISRAQDVATRPGGPERFAACDSLVRMARDRRTFH